MKHVMLDCYGANERQLDDIKLINEVLNRLVYRLRIKPIEPPHLLPYYYGSVKEDIGVSGKMLLLGGHVTIHTFPLRNCYFVDIFCEKDFNENVVIDFFNDELPFNKVTSNFEVNAIVGFGASLNISNASALGQVFKSTFSKPIFPSYILR